MAAVLPGPAKRRQARLIKPTRPNTTNAPMNALKIAPMFPPPDRHSQPGQQPRAHKGADDADDDVADDAEAEAADHQPRQPACDSADYQDDDQTFGAHVHT
jgi:hypothetical protein